MNIKALEIRDRQTFIPALGILIPSDHKIYVINRSGFQGRYIFLMHLTDNIMNYDWSLWNNRTMSQAHLWLNKHWDEVENEGVIDVEYILGESKEKKISEKFS
jgi:hypothetical protein